MAISNELFMAILSMDAYNRGYDVGLIGLSDAKDTELGNAKILSTSAALLDANRKRLDQAAGFYAVAYQWNGQTVISYRGTDNITGLDPDQLGGSDALNGWLVGAGAIAKQATQSCAAVRRR